MIEIVEPKNGRSATLDTYAAGANFVGWINDLRALAQQVAPKLKDRTIWMVNSTAVGGGVAEMLPQVVRLLRELGVQTKWAVINTDEMAFFHLTKRIHNLIHGVTSVSKEFGPEDAMLYEAVNRANAESFKQHLGPNDIIVIHDPQPLPMGQMIAREHGNRVLWRCHIGLDHRTDATSSVWRFLRSYCEGYSTSAFSAPEYIPSFLGGNASILHPAIDPLSHKNRELFVHKLIGIMCNSGIKSTDEPLPTLDYEEKVRRVGRGGELVPARELGLLFRPIVLQVSRWDALKGWQPLLDAFVRLKQSVAKGELKPKDERNQRRLELTRLVLAGPDPASIQDDPEGVAVFEQLRESYKTLPEQLQADVAILLLPMKSRKENALIVNALQRCSSVVVQNSLQEGFGLTVTEAMWKHTAVLGTHACGIRQQIRDKLDGLLSHDPEDSEEISKNLYELLSQPRMRYHVGRSARRRVHDSFLIFAQLSRYLELLSQEP